MTQTNYRPTLALKLASMQTPDAVETSALASFGGNNQEEAIAQNLLLHPGEPGEMLVQLENLGSHPLRWKLVIEGDFPGTWCNWYQEEAEEIAPNQKVDKELSFQIPEDFFENQFSLMGRKARLQINYEAQVYVYAEGEIQQQLIGYRVFNICVRPHHSYLNFLPAIYREIDFMGRFLTIFEQAFDPAVQTIDVLWAYLDPLTAPEAMLPFLAHWVAWNMEQRWDSKQQRRLIRNAVTLYRWHGTRRGLRYYLHLYTGLPLDEHLPESEKHISIEEIFSQGFVLGKTLMGEDSMLGGARPFHFIVRLRTNNSEPIDEQLVRDIIEREKPAFCTYDLELRT
ncbi:phage tail protein [Floridanema evergladense]|uniref:Phage tail protein n=1 Tax=Floridaenema evergladense BLCC-F167 TaxID=3153639 RepID=A0ABV4WLV3_9CYAN